MLLLVALFCASGADCTQFIQRYTQPIPQALPEAATLPQVLEVANRNASRIASVSSQNATIQVPGMPGLPATIAFQRPNNFRLRGSTALTGPEVDLGSNPELFWFWVKRNQPPAVFFCRHDQFESSGARQILPVEPEWLVEALGVVSFDPSDHHEGPFNVQRGRLEIRTTAGPNATGLRRDTTRIVVLDASRGYVLEEHIYDRQGQRLASATLSKQTFDQATGVVLPRHVDIQCPPAKFELSIELSDVQVNQLATNSAELWTKPQYPGYNDINLADPNLHLTPAPPTATRPGTPPAVPPLPPNVRY